MKKWLVTGGCGFIGSNFIRLALETYPDLKIVNMDKLTYAVNSKNEEEMRKIKKYSLIQFDIADPLFPFCLTHHIDNIENVDVIIHFAAETHVDNSLIKYKDFVRTNINGTINILEGIKHCKEKPLLIMVSTDEVYGSLPVREDYKDAWMEHEPYEPNSPYSASKASAEHFVRAYGTTWNVPYIITNCGNNFGPYQHVEKFIPKIITNAVQDKPIPVYGRGINVRDWIYVTDHCKALFELIENGMVGEKYNIGGTKNEKKQINNLDLTYLILDMMGKSRDLVEFVPDRLGHDLRYSLDTYKIQQLGWKPEITLKSGLADTINWYRNNEWFWR